MKRKATEMPARCAQCDGREFRDVTETLSVALPRSGVSASGEVAARRCTNCSHVVVASSVIERFRLALGCELADAGVRTGEAIRHMRNALGLRAADLAQLLDLTAETISHWETGKALPNRSAFIALAAMVEDALEGKTTTRDRLVILVEGGAYPRTIAVAPR